MAVEHAALPFPGVNGTRDTLEARKPNVMLLQIEELYMEGESSEILVRFQIEGCLSLRTPVQVFFETLSNPEPCI